ncbi:MAG TPA: glycosyltransferase family 39 protein [Chitinophagaceae bacterium]
MTNWINRNTSFLLITGLVVLYILSAIINLGLFNLQGEEPRRAIISIEMLRSGDYVVPHALGWEYYNKPPLYNWILSGFMWLTGSQSEFALRLPSLVFLLIWGFCHYLICRKWFSQKLSLLSTFFMLTSADIFFYGLANGAEIDIFYSLVVYLQVISLFWFYEQKKWWPLFLLSYLFCAIGFLTKGLPSLMFQGLTLAALCVYTRSVKVIFKPQHLVGIALFVLVAGSYFYAYGQYSDPSVMLVNIVNESLKKSVVGEESVGRFYKILSYPTLLFKLLAPWCLLLLLFFKRQRFKLFANPLVKFSFLFIVFNIAVYWFTGIAKLRYIYMFIPFAMNIFVYLYEQFDQQNPGLINKYLKYVGVLFIIIFGAVLALPFFYDINTWLIIGLSVSLMIFLLAYFKPADNRIWLFIAGLILTRLVYAIIGIPIQSKGMADYRPMMTAMVKKANGEPVQFYLPADSLKLDVVAIDTLYKWKGETIWVPPFLLHQIPYYYNRSSAQVMQYDTAIATGRLYVSYDSILKNKEIDRVFAAFDRRANDSLVLFRQKAKNVQ